MDGRYKFKQSGGKNKTYLGIKLRDRADTVESFSSDINSTECMIDDEEDDLDM